jgi:hypothetical protein
MVALTDAELDLWMRDNQPLPPRGRTREGARAVLQADRDAQERLEAQRGLTKERPELAVARREIESLKRRVAKLEELLVATLEVADKIKWRSSEGSGSVCSRHSLP